MVPRKTPIMQNVPSRESGRLLVDCGLVPLGDQNSLGLGDLEMAAMVRDLLELADVDGDEHLPLLGGLGQSFGLAAVVAVEVAGALGVRCQCRAAQKYSRGFTYVDLKDDGLRDVERAPVDDESLGDGEPERELARVVPGIARQQLRRRRSSSWGIGLGGRDLHNRGGSREGEAGEAGEEGEGSSELHFVCIKVGLEDYVCRNIMQERL